MMNKKSLYKLEYNKIIEKLTEHAGSFGGQERCRKLKPKTEISEIERMQEETAAAFTRIVKKGRPSFGGCSPVSESMMRLEIGGTLGSGELLRICKVLETAGHVKNYGRHDNADDMQDILDGYFEQLVPVSILSTEIRRCIPAEDEISDDASPELKRIRRAMGQINDKVHATLSSMVNGSLRTYLQDPIITMRGDRYCIPVKAEYRGQVPGMIHDQSSTGSTLFIEPMAVVKLNNDLKELYGKEQEEIEDFDLLIVTGPNTGGKTVSLKTVGLFQLMGQAGLHIPALDRSELGVFREVYADIGDEQSIEQNLSTFSSHMTNVVSFIKQVDEDSLVLFDELGAGTDPTEGAALATAILNHLHCQGIRTMATTHYSELKVYALSTPGVENASCEFDVETLRPTYRLLLGIPGKSNAFAIAGKLGLPDYIIEEAKTHLTEQDESFEDLLTDLESSRRTIAKEQEEIAAYRRELEALKQETAQKKEKLEEQRDRILREANEKAHAILADAKETADETMRNFHKFGKANVSATEMEKERERLRKKMEKTREGMTEEVKKPKKQYKPSDFKLGETVKVLSMNLTGTVHSLPDTKGNLMVQMGILSSKVHISDLEIVDEKPAYLKKTAARTSKGKVKMGKSMSVSPEINLLGKTVDEAVAELDKYLDDASLAHLTSVRVVHGKGTGALRAGIHQYLKRQKHVKSYRLGAFGEGDAGVTIVELK